MSYHYRDPLGDYLRSHHHIADDMPDDWTPELAEAVKHFLVHEISDAHYRLLPQLLSIPSLESREAQADAIIAAHEPAEVSWALHAAEVRELPTLEAVIGNPEAADEVDLIDDVSQWLAAHATSARLDD